nr:12001_t:CDS:2 [Entrophospora candida]
MSKQDALVWIDCEMTGLDTDKDHIIEVAGPDLIVNQSKEIMDNMNDWCKKHHGESGLTSAVLSSSITTSEAASQILEFLKKHIPEGTAPLAGNSVHADKMFLKKEMPQVIDYLHYRIIDVSSIKELCRRWYPIIFNNMPPKKLVHRALGDIKESIVELKYYRRYIFTEQNESNSSKRPKEK